MYFASPDAFRAWLDAHHADADALWVGFWKKGTGRPSLTWPESVDEALCYGWIDGIRQRIDDEAYAIRFTPRRKGSTWSLRNLERYEALESEGRIRDAGREAYARRIEAKTGTYSFERKTPAQLPEGFEDRLRAVPRVWEAWQAFAPSHRRKVTHWLASAKKEETRVRRLEKLIRDLSE
ncbi:MAG: YdeI/OmpD-associated family protein [Gemmatimonadetes bacterium]|nr:YdeI/OmpD-associated family protein [Gemmatimonadota bacterium]NNK61742.1 bacteriocin-protection protein [Gemmatimonadota bacterium]